MPLDAKYAANCIRETTTVNFIIEVKTTSLSKGASYHFSGYRNLPIGSHPSLYPKTHNIINANHG